MSEFVRLGNLVTKIDKCGLDEDIGDSGLFEQFISVTPQEAVAGKAVRKCKWNKDQEITTKIEVDENGYCKAECLGIGCPHLRG